MVYVEFKEENTEIINICWRKINVSFPHFTMDLMMYLAKVGLNQNKDSIFRNALIVNLLSVFSYVTFQILLL